MFKLLVGVENVSEGASDKTPIHIPTISVEIFNFVINIAIGWYILLLDKYVLHS
jgi:hypothetical protein